MQVRDQRRFPTRGARWVGCGHRPAHRVLGLAIITIATSLVRGWGPGTVTASRSSAAPARPRVLLLALARLMVKSPPRRPVMLR